MRPEARLALAGGPVGAHEPRPVAALTGRAGLRLGPAFVVAAVTAGYFLESVLGLLLRVPAPQLFALWPSSAILLATFLVTPRRRWWIYLLAVLPAHLLAQALKGVPFGIVPIHFAGNAGEALLSALVILHFIPEPRRFDRLRTVILIMLIGGLLVPALVSLAVAQLLALTDAYTDPWLAWRLRLLMNSLAVFTLVPPIVLAVTQVRTRRVGLLLRRGGGEAGALLTGLLLVAILLFELPRAGLGESPLLLYLPLPLFLWAAVRFGLVGVCLSMLTLGALATWSVVQGYGPFALQDPVENATSLILFLNFSCAPLLMLAALLEERESVEEEQRQAQTLHGAVLASVHDQIAVLDRDGFIREVNPSWSASGLPGVGTNYLDLCQTATAAPGEGPAQRLAGVEEVLSGASRRFQTELASSTSPGVWLEMSAEGLKRPEGGAVITHTDITSRKQAELEARLQRQELAHLTRVAMLGELSGALAHELNQPLTAILSNAQAGQRLLAREPVDLAEVRDILHDIAEDDRRAGEVIKRLRAMLKKDEAAKLLALDLNELMQEVLGFAHGDLITRNVSVEVELAPELPPVHGDRVQLQQVLLNLVLNAVEAMSAKPARERKLTLVTARDGDDDLRVLVVDRGTGIPADEMERVFEPFFTTKEHGLGIGLPICRSIVEVHGGRLWASNNEDCGATFHLILPREANIA